MFVSQTHLPQVLPPDAYCSPEFTQREIAKLFLPGWHFLGLTTELPGEGSFFTRELLGHPIIVWRASGGFHAFLNVCAHRMALLTHKPCGTTDKLKCQYHGWEYDESGNTRKIPDSKSFRPLQPGILGLRKYRCETVGQCVFVTLSETAPSLREYLGPGYDLIEEITGPQWESLGVGDRTMDCNWKIYLENTTESYHAETVHPTTLKVLPPEETCSHYFGPRWSLLRTSGKPDNLDRMDAMAHRWLRVERDLDYQNLLVYPNIAVGKMALFGWVDQVLPLGPGKMQIIARGFSKTGASKGLRAKIMRWGVRRWGGNFLSQLVAEDAAVLPDVQRGLSSPAQPKGGMISIREERVFHFQQFIEREIVMSGPALDRPPEWLPGDVPEGGACAFQACADTTNGSPCDPTAATT